MNNFHYAMYLANSLYSMDMLPEDFEEIGLIAWGLIGNKRTRLYRTCLDIDCGTNTVQLPCNCDIIEAITYGFEDWEHVSNIAPNGDYNSLFTESYIEARKNFNGPLYIPGKFVKYERVGDTLYLDANYNGKIFILYKGQIVDDDGLPQLTDKEALAIATYCAYVNKFKEGLSTNNMGIVQMEQALEIKWNRPCDAAIVPDSISQNEMNEILDAKSNWNRKIYGKTYKPLR